MNPKPSLRRKGVKALRHLGRIFKPYPVRTNADKLSCNPFFIVSTGRSGTTLLRAILNQHPDLCIPPESDYLWRVIIEYQRNYKHHHWRDIVTLFCGEMARGQEYCGWDIQVKGFYFKAKKLPHDQRSLAKLIDLYYQHYLQKHFPEALRWGDKTPHYLKYLPQLDAVYPNSQHLHIYRDGRDVVSSILKLGWTKTPEAACDMWLQRIQAVRAYRQRDNPTKFLEIRYEDMVHQPEIIITKICDFLNIAYKPEMLEFHQNPGQFRGDAVRPDLHPMLSQPISAKAIGKWRQALDNEQQAYVQERLAPTLTTLGYDLD